MGFYGKTLQQSYYVNDVLVLSATFAPATYIANTGLEYANRFYSIDVTDSQIRIDFSAIGTFSALNSVLTFADEDGLLERIVGVTINSGGTLMAGFDATDISFDGDHVWISWGGLSFNASSLITLDVQFAPPPPMATSLAFTDQADGTIANPIDFNYLADNAYKDTGGIYYARGGNDVVILPGLLTVDAGNPWSYSRGFNAGDGNDIVQGMNGNDNIGGDGGNDWLWGRNGNDDIEGGTGDDVLAGGKGADILNGGSGRDTFVFLKSEIGTTRTGEHDRIGDFHPGIDKIDVSALFSDVPFNGIQKGALSGTSADAYEIGFVYENGRTWVEGDITGDGKADFTIELANKQSLMASDLIVDQAQWESTIGLTTGFTFEQAHHDALLTY